MIKINNLLKTYDQENYVLNNFNLEINSTGFVTLLGRSGAGKSTLFNIIGLVDSNFDGEVTINGIDIKNCTKSELSHLRRNNIGFIFQNYNLINELNIEQNIKILNSSLNNTHTEDINTIFSKLKLNESLLKKPYQLSGAQQQRVAAARAIYNSPDILLCDEPTSNLDEQTGRILMNYLKEISKTKLVFMISHNEKLSYEYSDRVIHIENGTITKDENINDSIQNTEENEVDIDLTNKPSFLSSYMILLGIKTVFGDLRKTISFIIIELVLLIMFIALLSNRLVDYTEFLLEEMDRTGDFGLNVNIKLSGHMNIDTGLKFNQVISELHDDDILGNEEIIYDSTLGQNVIVSYTPNNLKYNQNIVGRLPINDTEILVTDYYANSILGTNSSISEYINETINFTINNYSNELTITGILETDYKDKYDSYIRENYNLYNRIFVSKDIISNEIQSKESFVGTNFLLSHNFENYNSTGLLSNYNHSSLSNYENIEDSLIYGTIPVGKQQVLISSSILESQFRYDGDLAQDLLDNDPDAVALANTVLLQSYSYTLGSAYNYVYHNFGDIDDISITGIYIDNSDTDVLFTDELFHELKEQSVYSRLEVLVYLNSSYKKTIKMFKLNDLGTSERFISEAVVERVNYKTEDPEIYLDINTYFIGMLILLSCFVYVFTGMIIDSSRRTLSILDCIGVPFKYIYQMLISSSIVIVAVGLVISLVYDSRNFLGKLNNLYYDDLLASGYSALVVDFELIVITIAILIINIIIGVTVGIRKLRKISPIEAVKPSYRI